MKTSREICLEALCRMDEGLAYSNLLIDGILSESALSRRDRAFSSRLFYGVLERKITLDFIISKYSKIPLNKISCEVLNILRMGIYQLKYMDSVPDSAAVNESVSLVWKTKSKSAKGFVNAVLRNFIRDGKKIHLPDKKGPERLSAEFSCPKWLIKKWENEYGDENTERILKTSLLPPPVFIRVNTEKTDSASLLKSLSESGIDAKVCDSIENCLMVSKTGGIEHTPQYEQGLFHVQDLSSQILCSMINPKPGETVFDMCAAPGGKSFTLAQYMKNQGRVYSFDLHENRVNLIKKGAIRLSLDCITSVVNNAEQYTSGLGTADKVLCDVPCSGLGVIRRKPEIKYKKKEEFDGLPDVQLRILKASSGYVKKGGVLIYSTCTLSKKENEYVVNAFLKENSLFDPLDEEGGFCRTFFPDENGGDGFFAAMLVRKR